MCLKNLDCLRDRENFPARHHRSLGRPCIWSGRAGQERGAGMSSPMNWLALPSSAPA